MLKLQGKESHAEAPWGGRGTQLAQGASLRDTGRRTSLTSALPPTASFPLITCPVTGRPRQVSLLGQRRVEQGEGKIWRAKGRYLTKWGIP